MSTITKLTIAEEKRLIALFMNVITEHEASDKAKELSKGRLTKVYMPNTPAVKAIHGKYVSAIEFIEIAKYDTAIDWIFPVLLRIKDLTTQATPKMDRDQVITSYKMGETIGCWCEITHTDRYLSQWKDKASNIPCDIKTFTAHGKTLVEAIFKAVIKFILWYNAERHPTLALRDNEN